MNRLVAPNSHHRPRRPSPAHQSLRPGFTLIEVLVVITIIALLVALLLPAIGGVRNRAKIAECSFEIKAIESALVAAKDRFGGYPPSSFLLFETFSNYNNPITSSTIPANIASIVPSRIDVSTADAIRLRSKEFLRQAWPQIDFAAGTASFGGGGAYLLNGAECLVFFLGGMPSTSGGVNTCTGFSKNPLNPFLSSGSKEGPYFQFPNDRLLVSPSAGSPFLVFCDKLGSPKSDAPYAYLSSYDGRGYKSSSATSSDALMIGLSSGREYLQGTRTGQPSNAYLDTTVPSFNPKTYQIISPGFDRVFGTGQRVNLSDRNDIGTNDADNITNFSNGTLGN